MRCGLGRRDLAVSGQEGVCTVVGWLLAVLWGCPNRMSSLFISAPTFFYLRILSNKFVTSLSCAISSDMFRAHCRHNNDRHNDIPHP
jgi:hypothetical protein